MCAARWGHLEVVRVLLEWGADKILQDKASGYFVLLTFARAVPLHRYYQSRLCASTALDDLQYLYMRKALLISFCTFCFLLLRMAGRLQILAEGRRSGLSSTPMVIKIH